MSAGKAGRQAVAWCWQHRWRCGLLAVLVCVVAVNVVAFNHARAMTHFSSAGARTRNPEELGTLEKLNILFTGINLPRPENRRTPGDLGLNFHTRSLSTESGCLGLWYLPAEEPRALVVLFHGYAACKDSLLEEAHCFHELGCAALIVDFQGSGDSTGASTTIGVREADDVACAFHFGEKLLPGTPIYLYGQSMGAAAVMRACAAHGLEPAGLMVESPFDRLVNTVGARFQAMGLPAFPGAQLLVFWGGLQHGFNGFTHNPVDYAHDIRVPVLFLHGADDPRVLREQAQAVHDALAGRKSLVWFEGAGHESLLAANPARWREAASTFLPVR